MQGKISIAPQKNSPAMANGGQLGDISLIVVQQIFLSDQVK
jgi:hypothetical protein